jgi:hypothetical protein
MKIILTIIVLLMTGVQAFAQTYRPVTSKNKTYLATVKGVSYSYKNGVVTLKNNGKYDLGTLSIIASSKVDSNLFGIALFEEGLEKGQTVEAEMYFTSGVGKTSHDLLLKDVDHKNLILSFDKATRAQ